MRGKAGSAAAPAARCRNFLRWGSFISIPPSLICLLEHLVGAGEQRWGYGEAERFRHKQVYDEIELGRLLDRDVAWLRSAQDLVDEVAGAPVEAREVRSIGHETSRFEPFAIRVHCGQSRGEREAIDSNLVGAGERFTNNIKGICGTLEDLEGRCDIHHLPDFQGDGLNTERVGRHLDLI